ncbi:hypothetical protein, partial [Paraburkholderia tropica]|uniref:hypothetical protein n=1 Tax=Paraburkholderia tropica TaxID=92647 RepID=UPI001E2D7456
MTFLEGPVARAERADAIIGVPARPRGERAAFRLTRRAVAPTLRERALQTGGERRGGRGKRSGHGDLAETMAFDFRCSTSPAAPPASDNRFRPPAS